MKGVKKIIISI